MVLLSEQPRGCPHRFRPAASPSRGEPGRQYISIASHIPSTPSHCPFLPFFLVLVLRIRNDFVRRATAQHHKRRLLPICPSLPPHAFQTNQNSVDRPDRGSPPRWPAGRLSEHPVEASTRTAIVRVSSKGRPHSAGRHKAGGWRANRAAEQDSGQHQLGPFFSSLPVG